MFIHTSKYTINTDHIASAENFDNGKTAIHLSNGNTIHIYTVEAEAIWGYLNRQALSQATQDAVKPAADQSNSN